jgi:polynucleotide 5'-hydroxyl-kinase GRC3/NOL9
MVRLHEIVEATLARARRASRPFVVYLLGDVDTGKTTLMLSLADAFGSMGTAALLDGDVGQSTLGPPLTVSLGILDPRGTGMKIVAQGYLPGFRIPRYLKRFLEAERRLIGIARRRAATCIVDSVGFVEGVGSAIEVMEMEAIRPDIIIALQREDELESILEKVDTPSMVFQPPQGVRRKSVSERRQHRSRKFVEYFRGSRRRRLPLSLGEEELHRLLALLRGGRFLGFGSYLGRGEAWVDVQTPVRGAVDHVEVLDLRVHPEKGEI